MVEFGTVGQSNEQSQRDAVRKLTQHQVINPQVESVVDYLQPYPAGEELELRYRVYRLLPYKKDFETVKRYFERDKSKDDWWKENKLRNAVYRLLPYRIDFDTVKLYFELQQMKGG